MGEIYLMACMPLCGRNGGCFFFGGGGRLGVGFGVGSFLAFVWCIFFYFYFFYY